MRVLKWKAVAIAFAITILTTSAGDGAFGGPALKKLAIDPAALPQECALRLDVSPRFMDDATQEDRDFFAMLLGFHIGSMAPEITRSATAGASVVYSSGTAAQAVGVLAFSFDQERDVARATAPLQERYESSQYHSVDTRGMTVVLVYYFPGTVPKACQEAVLAAVLDSIDEVG